MTQNWIKPAVTWFGFLILAFANGALREFVLKRTLNLENQLAHQVSCLTGVIFWTTLTLILWDRLNITSLRNSVAVGLGWFTATLLFETFILNHKMSWAEILHTYNVGAGEYWGLVLLWVGLMPVALYLMRLRSI